MVSIEADGAGYRVTVDRDGDRSVVDTDLVVHGAGRISELSRLGLEAAHVEYGPKGINVAKHLQSTTNPKVYAAGDSADTQGMPLTPIGVFEGKVAASNKLKSANTVPDYAGVPTAVFTIPELARVGMLESEAVAAGIDLEVSTSRPATAVPAGCERVRAARNHVRRRRAWPSTATRADARQFFPRPGSLGATAIHRVT